MLAGVGFYVLGGICGVIGICTIFFLKKRNFKSEYRTKKDGSIVRVRRKVPELTDEHKKILADELTEMGDLKETRRKLKKEAVVLEKIIDDNPDWKTELTEDATKTKDALTDLRDQIEKIEKELKPLEVKHKEDQKAFYEAAKKIALEAPVTTVVVKEAPKAEEPKPADEEPAIDGFGAKTVGDKNSKQKKKENSVNEKTNQMFQLARKKDPIFLICFYGAMTARLMQGQFTTFYLLWVATFTAKKGVEEIPEGLISNKDGLLIYNDVITTSMILTLLLMPLVGYLTDRIPSEIQIVLVFGIRMTASAGFYTLERPDNFVAYVIPVIIGIFTNLENVVINALFLKKLPGDIRAALTGALTSVAELGKVVFSQLCIKTITVYGLTAPFGIIACLDGIMIIFTVIMSFGGAFDKEFKTKEDREELKELKEEKERRQRERELKEELKALKEKANKQQE